jgi:hypothetical protein
LAKLRVMLNFTCPPRQPVMPMRCASYPNEPAQVKAQIVRKARAVIEIDALSS